MSDSAWRKPGQWYGEIQTYWGLFLLIPGVGAVLSGTSAFLLRLPWYLILFYAAGVFCFLVLALDRISNSLRANTIFGKLQIIGFNPIFGKTVEKRSLVNCFLQVQNRSNYDIYYQLTTFDLSLDGKTFPAGTFTDQKIAVIPGGGSVNLSFASIFDIEPKAMTGDMKLRLSYGKSRNRLPLMWEAHCVAVISVVTDPATGNPMGAMGTIRFNDIRFY